MAASFLREKHVTFPMKSEKALTELLKKYLDKSDVDITGNDLRNPESRWWQEILFVLLDRTSWIHFDKTGFMTRIQNAQSSHRVRVFVKLLFSYWSEIGQMAFLKPPLEILDIIRPTKERVAQLMSGYINLDAFVAAIPDDPSIESFGDIVRETKEADDQALQYLKRSDELETKVQKKKIEVAQNAEAVFQLKCEADRVANNLQDEKDTLENLISACDEKNDALNTLDFKIEDLERKTGVLQSEIDRIRVFHVPDIDSFLQEPIMLRHKFDDLRKEANDLAKRQSQYMEQIQVYQHLDEEVKACYAIFERNLKIGRELEDVRGQLNAMEETVSSLQAESKRKVDEHNQLKQAVGIQEQQQGKRQRSHAASPGPSSQSSQRSAAASENLEDDSEVKGRMEEGEALMQLLQQRERLRQKTISARHELEIRYHNMRDRLADNHDHFIDFVRGLHADLVKEGLVPPPARQEDDLENSDPQA